MMESMRKYNEAAYYGVEDIANELIALSGIEKCDELESDVTNALYHLQAIAQNPYDSDYYPYNSNYFRVFYNLLQCICGALS